MQGPIGKNRRYLKIFSRKVLLRASIGISSKKVDGFDNVVFFRKLLKNSP